jgi:hypothetical protein
VSGVVTDAITGSPVAGVSYDALVDSGSFGYSYTWANGAHATDGAGRYQLVGLADGAMVRLQVWKDGYTQQCAAPVVVAHGDRTLDAPIVALTQVSASTSPVAPAPGSRTIMGTIFRTTATGRQPVAGMFIDFEPVMDFPAARTLSDASGHYLLCGLPAGEMVELGTSTVSISVGPGVTTADVEIK